jgi:hypothetical protein
MAHPLCLAVSRFSLYTGLFFASNYGLAQTDFFNSVDVDIEEAIKSDISIIGWITQNVSYGLEEPSALFSRTQKQLNGFQTSIYLQADGSINEKSNFRVSGKYYHDDVYRLRSEVPFSTEEKDQLRNRTEVRDFYIDYQAESGLYVKLGNQILAWGLAEYIRVTDLINVEDQFAIAQQDLEDLRLQAPAALFSYRLSDWLVDAVITFDADRNQISPEGDEFDQFAPLRNIGLNLRKTDVDKQHEGFVRVSTQLPKGDFQLVAGEFNDNLLSLESITQSGSADPTLTFSQNRMRAIGAAANWVEGAWLFYGELGIHYDRAVIPNPAAFLTKVNGWSEKDQVLAVAGIEYTGFSNLLLSLELDSIHTRAHDQSMLQPADQISLGTRFFWTALNERLQVLGVWNKLANNQGRVSRLSVDYNWSDNFNLGLLWVDYHTNENSFFYEFRNNDVLQLQLRYNFQWQ